MTVPRLLHPFSQPGRTDFTRIVSGHGSTVVDEQGNEYLDAIASLWYANVGHGRAEVIDAVTTQMRHLAVYNTFGSWTNGPADDLAELISDRAPMPDPRVFFADSGSEAVDTAMKLARLVHALRGDPERTLIIARDGGYHGTAYGGTSAQGIAPNRDGFGPFVGDVVHAGRHDLEAMALLFAEHGDRVAAVIAEPVQGASGVHPPEPGYLAGLRRLCDQHGALLIFDEVISGFGRLGSWFAGQHYEVEPDLVTFAKAVTSGYVPLGGVIVGRRVREALESEPDYVLRTGFTYSGHPTACAAGIACIAVAEAEGLLDRAVGIGDRLGPALHALAVDGSIAAVRGVGGIWAVDVHDRLDRRAADVVATMFEAGVIVRPIGEVTLAMCPPLVITDPELDRLVDVLAGSLG